jgi:hypothetical protein
MAYFIFNNENNLVKIALNDADKNSLNLNLTDHNVEEVSQNDYNSFVFQESTVGYDGTTVTLSPIDYSVPPDSLFPDKTTQVFMDGDDLKVYLDSCVLPAAKEFLEVISDNSMYDSVKNYYEYLQNLDYSTITYPINYSWEKYCNDNGISFFHPLQIP